MRKPDIDDGGPAFPTPRNEFGENSESMSLRDWFAGQVLAGLLTSTDETWEDVAKHAYRLSDAMLAERAKAR